MKLRNIFAATLIAGTSCLISCDKMMDKAMQTMIESVSNHDYQDSEKWGKVVTVDLPTLAFHEVETSGAIRLEYTQDSTYSVQVYGNEKAIEAYTITSEDEELVASLKEGTGTINKNTPAITLRITAPFLTDIHAMGASDIILKDSISQDKELDINIGGAGNVKMDNLCLTENLEVITTGAANLEGRVECRKLKLKMSGAGSGNLDINSKQARLTLSGAVNVTVKGECHDFAYAATGSSSVKKEGLNKGEE
ncbi:MAG: DUF2807 domain-containing protein [Bacteroidaceae bacterium]|nr:DUF2807 domain-containing protein [Bacteroidaceae bacterium]